MKLTILGGGVAGLSAALAARRRGVEVELHEASARLGGNATTFRCGEFAFDSGAHRFHDRHPEVTREMWDLLGERLARVDAPSRVHFAGRFVDFPLSPLDLLVSLPIPMIARAAVDALRRPRGPAASLRDAAIGAYGRTIAETFLVSYSEKLWGVDAARLSPEVAGKRLRGLDLRTLWIEAMRGARAKTAHLDGDFLYPRGGIGGIADALARACPAAALRTDSRATRIIWKGTRVERVCLAGKAGEERPAEVDQLVTTIPLPALVRALDPPPPRAILDLAGSLRFRNVVLVAVFLDRDGVSRFASTYFPTKELPFTRVHEPKRRDPGMAPPGKTSLVAEIPCFGEDAAWREGDDQLSARVAAELAKLGFFEPREILGTAVRRLHCAYPVLELGAGERVRAVREWLARLRNVGIVGRASAFSYTHIHDLIRAGFEAVDGIVGKEGARPLAVGSAR